jgi:lipopolysaccharide export system permease protein
MKILKIHHLYIIKNFMKNFMKVTGVFICVIFIMNLFEEINFLKNTDAKIFLSIFLTLLNLPSILFEVFPFIFLLTTIIFFLNIINSKEIEVLRIFGLNNFALLRILSFTSLLISLFIVSIFYHLSANLKFKYLDIKNSFTKDDKYLAVITGNGLWIRDEIKDRINIINASKINGDYLEDVIISEFDKDFTIMKIISSDKAYIKNNEWLLQNVFINLQNQRITKDNMLFISNFNLDKLLSMFDNLSALSLFEIGKLKKDYQLLGYSTNLIDNYRHKIYSYPIYLVLMFLIGSILILKIKHNKPKVFYIVSGILLSVTIYYINFFISNVAEAKNISFMISVWGIQFIYFLIIIINLIKINEK